jgi:hypothetical protein
MKSSFCHLLKKGFDVGTQNLQQNAKVRFIDWLDQSARSVTRFRHFSPLKTLQDGKRVHYSLKSPVCSCVSITLPASS